ncbi:MAG: hypothetical protein IPJ35_05285 [Elusimicrobia bacterium]|nr:hypothetical protein [Elusimicrobiota bacterium]
MKSVCAHLGVTNVRSGEEEIRSGEALKSLAELGCRAGGSAPLPELPDMALLNDLTSKSGGERLVTMASHEKDIKALWDNWKIQVALIEKRKPTWDRATRLVSFGKFLPELDDARAQLEAVKTNRSLLAEPDPVAPILLFMVGVIRNKLLAIHTKYEDTVMAAQTTLDADANWLALKPEQQTKILVSQTLDTPEKPSLSSDDALLAALESASLETRADWIALVPTRVGNALAEAARLTKPASRILKFPPVTLETTTQVESWFLERKHQLLEEIKKGPVILG